MRTLVCRHCGRTTLANKKLKHLVQQYCGYHACQRARKLSFERYKYKSDGAFRTNKLKHARDRKNTRGVQDNCFSGFQYQRDYRASHPDYVLENRQKQRGRNASARDKTSHERKIVNPDAILPQRPDNDKVYAMIAVDYKKIVNPDAFMSKLVDIMPVTRDRPMFVRLL